MPHVYHDWRTSSLPPQSILQVYRAARLADRHDVTERMGHPAFDQGLFRTTDMVTGEKHPLHAAESSPADALPLSSLDALPQAGP